MARERQIPTGEDRPGAPAEGARPLLSAPIQIRIVERDRAAALRIATARGTSLAEILRVLISEALDSRADLCAGAGAATGGRDAD